MTLSCPPASRGAAASAARQRSSRTYNARRHRIGQAHSHFHACLSGHVGGVFPKVAAHIYCTEENAGTGVICLFLVLFLFSFFWISLVAVCACVLMLKGGGGGHRAGWRAIPGHVRRHLCHAAHDGTGGSWRCRACWCWSRPWDVGDDVILGHRHVVIPGHQTANENIT